MNGETQANRLAQLMQKKGHLTSYELALPLVTVRSSSLKNLILGDILILGLNSLECVLLDSADICANVVLVKYNGRYSLKIVEMEKQTPMPNNSKKYETFKLSFGMIQSRTLSVGNMIDITQINLNEVDLLLKEKKIATASLINVDDEIAVKIDKVEK
jgi:hypothetical protein